MNLDSRMSQTYAGDDSWGSLIFGANIWVCLEFGEKVGREFRVRRLVRFFNA